MKKYCVTITAATLILGTLARAETEAPGTMESTFRPQISRSYTDVVAVAVQADGRVLLGGDFTSVNGTTVSGIARLQPDGSLDSSFAHTPGANGYVYVILPTADGSLLVG